MAAPSGCLPLLNSCSPLPACSERHAEPGADAPSSSHTPPRPLLCSPGAGSFLANKPELPRGAPRSLLSPPAPQKHLLQLRGPGVRSMGWLFGEHPSQGWTTPSIRTYNETLGNASASYKRLLERLARQIHKCSLPLPLRNERELCEATTTEPFLCVDRQQQPARTPSPASATKPWQSTKGGGGEAGAAEAMGHVAGCRAERRAGCGARKEMRWGETTSGLQEGDGRGTGLHGTGRVAEGCGGLRGAHPTTLKAPTLGLGCKSHGNTPVDALQPVPGRLGRVRPLRGAGDGAGLLTAALLRAGSAWLGSTPRQQPAPRRGAGQRTGAKPGFWCWGKSCSARSARSSLLGEPGAQREFNSVTDFSYMYV